MAHVIAAVALLAVSAGAREFGGFSLADMPKAQVPAAAYEAAYSPDILEAPLGSDVRTEDKSIQTLRKQEFGEPAIFATKAKAAEALAFWSGKIKSAGLQVISEEVAMRDYGPDYGKYTFNIKYAGSAYIASYAYYRVSDDEFSRPVAERKMGEAAAVLQRAGLKVMAAVPLKMRQNTFAVYYLVEKKADPKKDLKVRLLAGCGNDVNGSDQAAALKKAGLPVVSLTQLTEWSGLGYWLAYVGRDEVKIYEKGGYWSQDRAHAAMENVEAELKRMGAVIISSVISAEYTGGIIISEKYTFSVQYVQK